VNLSRLDKLAARGRQLMKAPTARGDWYRITATADDRTEVFIYDAISEWGVNAGDFVRDLRAITTPSIDLHLNSPGGLVFDGIAIFTALRNHPATVTSYVDGIAASAASFVAMAGDDIVMEKPAKMMIHDAQGVTIGGPQAHREMLDLLDELSDTIAEVYADRAGGTVADWRAAMRRETWYSAAQAVKAGLADRIADGKQHSKATPEDRRSQMIRARARVTLRGGK
jgi:ATP-dependent protease ClpP protease subunit